MGMAANRPSELPALYSRQVATSSGTPRLAARLVIDINKAKVRAVATALAANDVVNGDQGNDDGQHYLQGRRQRPTPC